MTDKQLKEAEKEGVRQYKRSRHHDKDGVVTERSEQTSKIGAVIFSPGDQRNCAVGIVLEGQNAEDAYNVTAGSYIEVHGFSVISQPWGLLNWLTNSKNQVTVTMTVDENRNVVKGCFNEMAH